MFSRHVTAAQPRPAPDSGAAPPEPRTILLATHDSLLAAWIGAYLTQAGFTMLLADNGPQALALARQQLPDLLLVDQHLPDGGGIDLCRRLRAPARVPTVVIAADTSQVDAAAALDSGADDVLGRLCSPAELAARVRAILRRTARRG